MYEYVGADSWRPSSVYDLADWKNGLAFKNIEFSDTGLPVIKIAELKNGITRQTARTAQRYDDAVFVRAGDMLFSWSGNPDTSIDVFRWQGEDGWLNQHIFKVTPKSGISNEFLFLVLKWLRPRFAEIARNKQTTGLGHVTLKDLKQMVAGVPHPHEQAAIVDIVAPLQRKVELNRQTNRTLEATGKAIYRDWFVEFGPVRAKEERRTPYLEPSIWAQFPDRLADDDCPEGWGQRPLFGIADFSNGAAYGDMHFSSARDGLPVVKIVELKTGITAATKFTAVDLGDRYRIDSGELLFSWSGNPDTSIDTFIWLGGPAWLNQHIYRVRENGTTARAAIYFQLKLLKPTFAEIARNKQTTGLGHVTADDMRRLMVCDPPSSLAQAYDEVAGQILQRMIANELENHALARTRDLLLPKLMSGELRLKDAEKAAEAVL